jgi:hypothetical protein
MAGGETRAWEHGGLAGPEPRKSNTRSATGPVLPRQTSPRRRWPRHRIGRPLSGPLGMASLRCEAYEGGCAFGLPNAISAEIVIRTGVYVVVGGGMRVPAVRSCQMLTGFGSVRVHAQPSEWVPRGTV